MRKDGGWRIHQLGSKKIHACIIKVNYNILGGEFKRGTSEKENDLEMEGVMIV